MSLKNSLIRASMEAADTAADVTVSLVPADLITDENADQAVDVAQQSLAVADGEVAELTAAVESCGDAITHLSGLADSLESMDPLPVKYGIEAISLGLENALVPAGPQVFTTETMNEVTEKIKAEATDTQDAAKGVRQKAKEILQRLVKFMRDLWRKFTSMLSTIFNAIVGVKTRVKRFQGAVNAADLSVAPKVQGIEFSAEPKAQTVYQGLIYQDRFSDSPIGVLDGLGQVQTYVNTLDSTFSDRYALDVNRLVEGIASGHADWIREMANSAIAVPQGFKEIQAGAEGERVWVSGSLPGNNLIKFTQSVISVGNLRAIGYDSEVVHRDFEVDASALPLLKPEELSKIGDKIIKILEGAKDGKKLIDKAAQANERSASKIAISPTTVSLLSLFHRRYRAVGRMTMRMNSLVLKTALHFLTWGELTLQQYPTKKG